MPPDPNKDWPVDMADPNIDWWTVNKADPEVEILSGMGERSRIFSLWEFYREQFKDALRSRFDDDFHQWLAERLESHVLDDWFRRNMEAKDIKGNVIDVYGMAQRFPLSVLYAAHGGRGPAEREFMSRKLDVFTGGVMPPVNVFAKLLRKKFEGDEDTLRQLDLLSDLQLLKLYDQADTGFHWTMDRQGYMTASQRMLQDAVDLIGSGHIRAHRHQPGWAEEQPVLAIGAEPEPSQMPLFREGATLVVSSLLEADDKGGWYQFDPNLDWSDDPDDPNVISQHSLLHGYESVETVYEDENVRLIKPLNATAYNKYAEKANKKPFDGHPTSLKEDTYLAFIALPKNELFPQPVFLSFDHHGTPYQKTATWLDPSQVRSELLPFVASVRKGLASYAAKKRARYSRAQNTSDYDYTEQINQFTGMLFTVGSYAQVRRHFKKQYPDPDWSPMETHLAWPMIAQLLVERKLKEAKEVMQYARISHKWVKFEADGFWVTWPDWSDLTHLFDRNSEETAEQLFAGELHHSWDSSIDWEDVWDRLDETSMEQIRGLLVGMPIIDDDEVEMRYHTAQSVQDLDSDDLKEMFKEGEYGEFGEITRAITTAGRFTEENGVENAYLEGYQDALVSALEAKRHEWMAFSTGETDAEGNKTRVSRLGFFFLYTAVNDWLRYSDEQGNNGRGASNFQSLVFEGTERASADDNYGEQADFDADYFNERVAEELPEAMDWELPEEDSQQLPLIAQEVHVMVFNQTYPNGITVRMTKEQADDFARRHPEQTSRKAWLDYVKQQR